MAIAQSQEDKRNRNRSRLPLVIEPDNRDTTTNKDARLVNAYMETVRLPDKIETHIYKRPGLLFSSQPSGGAAAGMGVYNWRGDIYSIFGGQLYKNGVAKGAVDATNGVYQFSSNLGITPMLQLGNGVKAYNYDDANGLVQILPTGTTVTAGSFSVGSTYIIASLGTTDFTLIGAASNTVGVSFTATGVGVGTGTATVSGFPVAFVKGWAFLDQTTYVMDSKADIQGSGLNDTVNWDPLNTLQAQIEPDGGVALGKQLVNVIALKQWTAEVFYDAGNATGSPLGRVPGAKANFGCLSQDSVQDVGGTLIWLATTRLRRVCVVLMDNLKVQVASSKPVERLLSTIDVTTVFSWQLAIGQHQFYGLTSKVDNLTLVLDLTERMWSQWTDSSGNYFPIVASAVDASGNHIMQHETNGKLYTTLQSLVNDDGAVITTDVYTPNYDGGVRLRKYISAMEFIADQTPGSTLLVRRSDDDYKTWSTFRPVDLSLRRPFLSDCGTFYTRAHHFRHKSNTTFRLQAVELQQGVGSL
jgi:hypothetical protein